MLPEILICPFLSDTFLPSHVTVKSTLNKTFLELKSTFKSLYTLREVSAVF